MKSPPIRALCEVAAQLSITRSEALSMVVTGDLPALVFTCNDALIADTSLAEFIEAHRYKPRGDR